MPRTRGRSRLLAGTALLLLAGGCGMSTPPAAAPPAAVSSPAPVPSTRTLEPTPAPAPAPALTVAQARRIHEQYRRQLARARAADGAGLQHAEAGLALELSRAQERLRRLRGQPPAPPARVVSTRMIIPRLPSGQPRWFAAEVRYADRDDVVHLIFAESAEGEQVGGWRVVAGSATPADQVLPRLATTGQGEAQAVPAHATGLPVSPSALARAHAASLSSADSDARARRLIAPGPYTSQAAAAVRAERRALAGRWRLRITSRPWGPIYALRTADGGALVWYALREQQIFTAVDSGAPPLEFGRAQAATLAGGRAFSQQAHLISAGWFCAVLPPAGDQRARIVGDWYSALKVNGA
ncbi:hypothetical protein [Planobispora rosea]|nr:hypothetical protein [Planobispora rosea]